MDKVKGEHHDDTRHRPIRHAIASYALSHGFDVVGFTAPTLPSACGDNMRAFVAQNNHGDMIWLKETLPQRLDPKSLLPHAKTLIMLGVDYTPQQDPLQGLQEKSKGMISVYAKGRDYHRVIKKRLVGLGRWSAEHYGGAWRTCVDTAPLMEKPLAQQAGLGWQGRHTHLVSRDYGSWLFLSSLVTTLDLVKEDLTTDKEPMGEYSTRHDDHCGSCRACLDICPTDAFLSSHRLNVHRCIAYLTIEHKGVIERSLRPMIGNRIFGCDDCLAVCPWNKFARRSHTMSPLWTSMEVDKRWHGDHMSLAFFANLSEEAFRHHFRGTAILRTGRVRFIRNVLIAIGNSGDKDLESCVVARLRDDAPLVRAMAVWALARLVERDRLTWHYDNDGRYETHDMVKVEWRAEGLAGGYG